ncbi:calcium-binding protein [Rhizobium herbae]|jgi:Ca2+-binding RTX toxin-like protein
MGATISVNSIYGLDIRELDFSSIYYASYYTTGTSIFRASYGGGDADEFRGAGFRYNAYGEPTAGTVTSYAAFRDGNKMFSVDGVAIAVANIVKVANTYSTTDDLSLITTALKGNDAFKGGNGADYVKLYAGNDILAGNSGNDTLNGGVGNDKITGGRGHDYLFGEAGSDTFIYKSITESTYASSGRDTIYDFTGSDKIDLSAIDAYTKKTGNQAFAFISTNQFSGKQGEVRYEKKLSDTYIYADVNGDKKVDFAIHLDDAVTMQKGYFVL